MTHRRVLIGHGLVAGLAATVAVSLVIVLQQALGILPQLSTVRVLAQALGFHSIAAGWLLHFVVGVLLWGPLYAWIDPKSSYPHWFIGMMFGTGVCFGVMLLIMPVVGAGLFGLELGMVTPLATLVLHWIYGAVLGVVFGSLPLEITLSATQKSNTVTT
jgi:hypothetical protein